MYWGISVLKNRRRVYLVIFILCFFLLLLWSASKISVLSNDSNSLDNKEEVSEDSLEGQLLRSTALNVNNLTGKKREKVWSLNEDIIKKKFFGAYVGIDNTTIKISYGNGYSNIDTHNTFGLDSVFFVGKYQDIVNNAMLLNLMSKYNLVLTQKVGKVLGNRKLNNTTFKDIIENKVDFYISSKSIYNNRRLEEKSFPHIYLTKTRKHGVLANPYVKAELISKVSGKSYSEVVNELFVKKMGLHDTRIANSLTQANDVKMYKNEKSKKGNVSQIKIKDEQYYQSNKYMKMSFVDMMISFRKITNGSLFKKKYMSTFDNALDSYGYYKNGYLNIDSNMNGQAVYMSISRNKKKMLVFVTNVSNETNKAFVFRHKLIGLMD